MARAAARRALPRATRAHGQSRGFLGTGDLRQLPVDRIPPDALGRLPVLQRLPGVSRAARGLSRAAAESGWRAAPGDGRDRSRQPEKRTTVASGCPGLAG